MTKKQRIEYLICTFCCALTSACMFGLVGFFAHPLGNVILSTLVFGLAIGGLGVGALVSTLILTARFFKNKSTAFKAAAAILWPVTYAVAVYVGIFMFIPYEIYNVIKIFTSND